VERAVRGRGRDHRVAERGAPSTAPPALGPVPQQGPGPRRGGGGAAAPEALAEPGRQAVGSVRARGGKSALAQF
jgi:hypothetical protein